MSSRLLRQIAVVGSLVLVAGYVAPSGAQEAPKPPPPPSEKKDPDELIRLLKDLIKGYSADNAALRARVKDLEAQVEALKRNRVVTKVAPPATQGQVPPTWKEVPFNGGVYYIVPLGQPPTASTAPTVITTTPAQPK